MFERCKPLLEDFLVVQQSIRGRTGRAISRHVTYTLITVGRYVRCVGVASRSIVAPYKEYRVFKLRFFSIKFW